MQGKLEGNKKLRRRGEIAINKGKSLILGMERGQGALEYLLLLGGAIVIAAIVVALILGLGTVGSNNVYNAYAAAEAKKLSAQKGVDLTGLKGYYKFDGDVKDYSGWGNNGNITGTSNYSSGKLGQALYVAGSPGKVDITKAINGRGDFTIFMWVKGALTISNLLYGNGTTTLYIKPNDAGNGVDTFPSNHPTNPTNWIGYTPPVMDSSTWHYIAWTRSGTSQKAYAGCNTTNLSGTTTMSGNPLSVDFANIEFPSNTYIDEVYILNRAMPDSDIPKLAGC